ncbi:efflux transporter outer membrane subunit [Phaeospirillum tilakii]|uniref:Efflux transporter outer membrane subunit n=1 Tax=Phaeospirillum tilakii TaxID=741673 RepID=A0ABW5CA02_9PROT
MIKKLSSLLAATTLLAGCSLIPDYLRPDAPVAPSWPQADSAARAGAPLMGDLAWKAFFKDPGLQALIEQALANNRDLRVAALNIEVARSTYRVSESALFPQINANGGFTSQRIPKGVGGSTADVTNRTYQANLGVTSWELDFFGKLSSQQEQAYENFLATEEARQATRISLIAEVANAALSLYGDRALLALTEETLASREDSLGLIQRSFDNGVSSQVDVAQARTAVETARVNKVKYQRQVELDKNALTLLLGGPFDESRLPSPASLDAVGLVEDMPAGLPSEVLLRRPDVAQAEHSLKAANANIGAARAAFFPSISLTASGGGTSGTLDTLTASPAWIFNPQITVPIFTAGKNQANLDSAKASRDIAVATYEKTIQTAFREVSDALAARATLTQQIKSQGDLVTATGDSYRLSRARYDRGVDSYLNVLDSQRSLYSAQQDLISTQVTRLSNLVTLYKVLGGGVERDAVAKAE